MKNVIFKLQLIAIGSLIATSAFAQSSRVSDLDSQYVSSADIEPSIKATQIGEKIIDFPKSNDLQKDIKTLQGGVNGGGGSVYISINQKPILWDFVSNGLLYDESEPIDYLSQTPFYKELNFEFFRRAQAYKLALNAAEKLDKYPKVKSIVKFAMNNLRLVYVFHQLKNLDSVYIPNGFSDDTQKIQTAIYYDFSFGGIINANLFNRMGRLSQAGLIFHETLRRLQLVYKIPITNEEIQLMTYYAFRNQLSINDNIWKATSAYGKLESQLFGESDELILLNNADKWICSEIKKVDSRYTRYCGLNKLTDIKEKTVISRYGDWIVNLDDLSSSYSPNSQVRIKLEYLRRIVELQLFNPNALSSWNTWEEFPVPGRSPNFWELSLMFNSPSIYFKGMSDDLKEYTKKMMTKYAQDLKREITIYFYVHYFEPTKL